MFLEKLRESIKENFKKGKSVLSFNEYLELFRNNPTKFLRNSAHYIHDCFNYYGIAEDGSFNLFKIPFNEGKDPLIDQIRPQKEFFRIIKNFITGKRISRLILIHGPNGSAKSRFVSCIFRALEEYSKTDEGALYTFNWIFPEKKFSKSSFGFKVSEKDYDSGKGETYAYLKEEEIEVRIPDSYHENPIFLIPPDERRSMIHSLIEEGKIPKDFAIPDIFFEGDLSDKNKKIFNTLLSTYSGDIFEVYKHIQVERFYLSARYRTGLVTIFPQLHVDAQVRQISANEGIILLPKILKNIEIFEPTGDLVDANRGMIEFDDLLKRPVDTFKYLLSACETGSVNLPRVNLYLDTVFVATSNDKHLHAFKKFPDFKSYKERFEFIKMPYIRNYHIEEEIYREFMSHIKITNHIAPHSLKIAAMWAVLTRIKAPKSKNYPDFLRSYISEIGPFDKMFFYSDKIVPEFVAIKHRNDFMTIYDKMLEEFDDTDDYEGSFGISPREMRNILYNASQDSEEKCLTPIAIFKQIESILKETSVFEFLKREREGKFFNFLYILNELKKLYLEWVNNEFLDVTGLVTANQYINLFKKYIYQVSKHIKGEKIYNEITGRYDEPDLNFIETMEKRMEAGSDRKTFREKLLQKIAAFKIENPDKEMDYMKIFKSLFENLKRSYYEEHKEKVISIRRNLTQYLTGDLANMTEKDTKEIEQLLQNLKKRYGYCEHCAKVSLIYLERNYYNHD